MGKSGHRIEVGPDFVRPAILRASEEVCVCKHPRSGISGAAAAKTLEASPSLAASVLCRAANRAPVAMEPICVLPWRHASGRDLLNRSLVSSSRRNYRGPPLPQPAGTNIELVPLAAPYCTPATTGGLLRIVPPLGPKFGAGSDFRPMRPNSARPARVRHDIQIVNPLQGFHPWCTSLFACVIWLAVQHWSTRCKPHEFVQFRSMLGADEVVTAPGVNKPLPCFGHT